VKLLPLLTRPLRSRRAPAVEAILALAAFIAALYFLTPGAGRSVLLMIAAFLLWLMALQGWRLQRDARERRSLRMTDDRVRELMALRKRLPHKPPPGWSEPWFERYSYNVDVGPHRMSLWLPREEPDQLHVLVMSRDRRKPVTDERAHELLALLRGVGELRETVIPEDSEPWCRSWSGPLLKVRSIRAEEDDEAFMSPCYAKASFELPEPIDFESAELAHAGAEHDAIVDNQLESLMFMARKESSCFEPLDNAHDYCAVIDARVDRDKPRVAVVPRTHAWEAADGAYAVQRKLIEEPGDDRMYVLVMDRDAISLRTLRVERKRPGSNVARATLVTDTSAAVVEPIRQRLVRSGDGWVLRWRATEDAPTRDTPVAVPERAATPEEFLDRLYARYEQELRVRVWRWRKDGRLADAYLYVSFNRFGGESVRAGPNDRSHMEPLLTYFPRVKEIVFGKTPPGWLPVVVSRVQFAGVRWMSLRVDESAGDRPQDVTEPRDEDDGESDG
jgi:hypothetical protein